jgi:protein arginine kinase activator
MLCSVCKEKPATVHYTKIDGGEMHKVDLCEACAKTKGVNDPTSFSLADMLLGLGAAKEVEESAGGSDLKCPKCGFTHADFKKAGRLGCSTCYQTFSEGLEGLLKTMHKGTRHIGKVPAGMQQARVLTEKVKALQKKLGKAIEDENFEAAAALRDELKQLSTRIGGTIAK